MHFVITGGAGFIGSHLADELVKHHEITIIDDLSTGRRDNIQHLIGQDRVTFLEGSVTNRDLLREAVRGADGIFHQAAYVSVPGSVLNPSIAHEINITGTLNILLAAREANVKKVVFASSAAVYGSSPDLPKREGMDPRPESPYALSKVVGEQYCQLFSFFYDVFTICLRYFNVYGPRQDPHSPYAAVIPSFISHLRSGQNPIIYGDGEQTRDFIHVKDVVRANLLAMEGNATGPFNIASGTTTSINELASSLRAILDVQSEPCYMPPRPGDIRDSYADITRVQECLDFKPQISIQEGLRETIAWMLTHSPSS